MIPETVARLGAAISHVAMWCAVGVLTSHVHAADGTIIPVNQDAIVVSLPVFIVSLVSTAGFTWAVARWDAARTKKVDKLENEIRQLLDERKGKP